MSERIKHFKWVLTDLIYDLTVPTEVFRVYVHKESFSPDNLIHAGVLRMTSNALIINLAKLWEVIRHYGCEINSFPEKIKQGCNLVKREIEDKKIYQFRSKYAAHIIDKDTNTPLSLSEGKRRYEAIVGTTIGDMNDFCNWVCPENYASHQGGSVVKVVTELRDHCLSIVGSCNERP